MITLEQAKYQCRVELDEHEEDALLEGYIRAARSYCQAWLDRTIYDTAVPSDDTDGIIDNASIDQACLLLIGHWYANREAVVIGTITAEVPLAVQALLQPYRRMGV